MPADADLTEVERSLVDHVVRGELLDLTDNEDRSIRASVIRDILRGKLAPDPDPHGLRLKGAQILGRVDLDNVRTHVDLQLRNCELDDGLSAIDAELLCVDLTGSQLRHPSLPALDGLRLTATVLDLGHAVVTAASEEGAVRLASAELGFLCAVGAKLCNISGPALHMARLQTERDVDLSAGFEAVGEDAWGAVQLIDARISGRLICSGADLRNGSGPALNASDLQVRRHVVLGDGFVAAGEGDGATVRLVDAQVGGVLFCSGALMRNGSGPALNAERSQIDGNVFFREGFVADGAGEMGAVRLLSSRIGGELDCSDASMRNGSGPALNAERLQVEGNMLLRREFEAVGSREFGAVRLQSGQIGGDLDCSGGSMRSESDTVLNGQGLQVNGNMFLCNGFVAVGGGERGVVRLPNARVSGVLEFDPSNLTNRSHPGVVLDVDGLVYSGLTEGVTWQEWLRLIRKATPEYAAQPYQQLAGALRAAGHDGEARQVLMAQRRDQIDRHALTGRAERAWARFTGWTLGYGYQPWRALIGLLVVVLLSVGLAVGLGAQGGLARTDNNATACSVVERVGVGLDMGVPLIRPEGRSDCHTTDQTAGQVLTVAGWTLQLLAWAFATLFVAGFTGAVRKT